MFKLQAIKDFPKVKGDKYKFYVPIYQPNCIYTVRTSHGICTVRAFWYSKRRKFYGSLYRLLAENGGIDNVDLADIDISSQEFGTISPLVYSIKLTNKEFLTNKKPK